jgi:hypothetical protein
MTRAFVLLCACLLACGEPGEAISSDQLGALDAALLSEPATAEDIAADLPFERVMRDCYAEALARAPSLEVHAMGRYLALGDTMMAVRVTIPKAPRLARCIEDAVSQSVPPGAAEAPDALGAGSFAIDLGGPPAPVQFADIERQYEEHQKGTAALMREVVTRGVLPADHPLVREALAAADARH